MKKKEVENEVETKEEIKEESKVSIHPDWVSIAIKLLILIGFIFLLIFAITNIKKSGENKTLNKNIELMRSSAYTYFKEEENRPIEENEEIDISLGDMIASDMIEELKLSKKVICDKEASYIAVTKVSDVKYNLDVSLTCGKKSKTENYVLNYSSLKNKGSSNSKETEKVSNTVSSSEGETTMYEQRRTIQAEARYECPDGFTLVGTKCYSNVAVLKASAVPIYNIKPAKNIPASYHREEVDYEYTEPLSDSRVALTCPNGYNLVNNKCEKLENPYSKNKYTYSCPDGYTLVNTKCVKTEPLNIKNAIYKCYSGTITSDNRCQIIKNANVSCKAGKYDSSKKMCYIEINATPNYSAWKDKGIVESKKTKINTTKTKYVYIGKTKNGKYRYRKYTRTLKNYSCTAGVYAGNGVCRYYHENYFKYSCSEGTLQGKQCVTYKNAVKISSGSSSCPSGYVKNGNNCTRTINATKTVSKTYYCKAGSTVTADKKCLTTTKAVTTVSKDGYACPDGYDKIGSGSSTKCRKKVVTPGYYYCHDDDAVLDNDRCITASVSTFKGYKCPSGYELAGNYCYKYTNTETIRATKIAGSVLNEEVIWSASRRLDGWTFTGNTKKV